MFGGGTKPPEEGITLLTLNLAETLELILNSEKVSINWMPHQSLDVFPCSVQQSFLFYFPPSPFFYCCHDVLGLGICWCHWWLGQVGSK